MNEKEYKWNTDANIFVGLSIVIIIVIASLAISVCGMPISELQTKLEIEPRR